MVFVGALAWLLMLLPTAQPLLAHPSSRTLALFTGVKHGNRTPSTSMSQSQRSRREKLLKDLEAPMEQRHPEGDAADDPAAPLALAACIAGDNRKAIHTSALRVSHLTSATSFFVSMVGRSKAQINAIVKNVEDEVLEEFGVRCSRQGKAMSGWVCLDYDSVVVNVFSEAQREYYGIEKYWAAGQPLDLSDVLTPSAPDSDMAVEAKDPLGDDDWELDDWDLDDDEEEDGTWSTGVASAAAVPFDFRPPPPAEEDGDNGAEAGEDSSEEEVREFVASMEDEDEEFDDLTEDEIRALELELDRELAAAEQEAEEALGEAKALDGESSGGVTGDGLFDEFGSLEFVAPAEPVEAVVATEAEEAEAVLAADALGGRGDDDADWALGDDNLRSIVDAAEAAAAGVEDGEGGEGGGGWRERMAEDGWSEADFEAEIEAAAKAADADDEDAGLDIFD